MQQPSSSSHRSRYEGNNLLRLLLLLAIPVFFLYGRVVLSLAASRAPLDIQHGFRIAQYILWAGFVVAQLVCARLVQKHVVPAPRSGAVNVLQYAGVLVVCVLFAVMASIICEAFALQVFLRMHR